MSDASTIQDMSQVLRTRREKLARLEERGRAPFAYRFGRTHRTREAVETFVTAEASGTLDQEGYGEAVRVAGRLVGYRSHGKSSFANIDDGDGTIQLYFRKNVLGDEAFDDLDLLDLGDWIGVAGPVFRTRMGEVSVQAQEWTLLAKSLRPLPLGKAEVDDATGERTVYGGFSDTEGRYRQRYADLAVNPDVRETFRLRSRIVRACRRFLDEHGYLEVETPVLQPLYGGASARPFVTEHNALGMRLYLRIADELYLKRLIVGGLDRVYEISKDFRNEGIDRFHNPEFTMLEFYEAFADYGDMMDFVEGLFVHVVESTLGSRSLVYQGTPISFEPPFARLRFTDSLAAAMGEDPLELSVAELRARADALGLPDLDGAGAGKLMDRLFEHYVQGELVQPTFVMDHPRELSPLAKLHRSDDRLTERFELFVAGQELANAFSELNDPMDQRRRFEDQAGLRAAGDEEAQQVDEDYLRALEYGMPPTGGVGVGIDRLTMVITDRASIRDVILFPTLRPEGGSEGGA